ncbi:MAG: hypothetical protein IJX13_07240 [Clostridia bacterium]|nr:hypothetical protein [Clostridia bacterium]
MFAKKNLFLIISVIIAVIWVFVGIFTMMSLGEPLENGAENLEDVGKQIGTAIGMALMMPYLIVSSVGALLHTIGGFVYKKGLVLAGLILECVSLLLGITWGFGFIPAIILGFIGYSKMKKHESVNNMQNSEDINL